MQLFCAWLWHRPRMFAWTQTPQSSVCLAQCSPTSTQRFLSHLCALSHWCGQQSPVLHWPRPEMGELQGKLSWSDDTLLFSLHGSLQSSWTSADCRDGLVWPHHCESSVSPDGCNAFKTSAMQCVCRNRCSTGWRLTLCNNVGVPWEVTRLLFHFLLAQTGENSYLSYLQIRITVQKTILLFQLCLPPECTLQWNYEQQRTFEAVIHFLDVWLCF